MADNDKKRYFWLKLKKDFFQQHKMKVLKALPNGRLYALIYMELLAESTSHNGKLRFSEMLPYDSVTLAAVIDEDKDNLEKAIEILEQLELLEILSDKTIYLSDIETMIGSETGKAERMREYRHKVATSTPQCSLEYREKNIDIRDKNIDDDKQLLKERLEIVHDRNIEACLYDQAKAYEINHQVMKAYSITHIIPSLQRLNEIVLKISDGGIFNEQGYLINCFKGESYDL